MTQAKLIKITIWVLAALVAALFLLSAIPKFFDEGWIRRFASWGYSESFLYIIGVLETMGAIGLLIPRLAPYAALGLIGIMIGAIVTHLNHDQGIVWNLAYIAVLLLVGWYRWNELKHESNTD